MMNFQQARTNMIAQQVLPWSVMDQAVLRTLAQIPREVFVPSAYINLAYSDSDIPLCEENKSESPVQTLLPPKIVGRALQALALTGHEKVLEIGTGTGYVTACLTKLASTVVSVEINPDLLVIAEKNLTSLHCRNIVLEQGNGAFGWASQGPYDAIFVTGSYPLGVPMSVREQLSPKGRLFAFVGLAPSMEAVIIEYSTQSNDLVHTLFETVVPALFHAPIPDKFQF